MLSAWREWAESGRSARSITVLHTATTVPTTPAPTAEASLIAAREHSGSTVRLQARLPAGTAGTTKPCTADARRQRVTRTDCIVKWRLGFGETDDLPLEEL